MAHHEITKSLFDAVVEVALREMRDLVRCETRNINTSTAVVYLGAMGKAYRDYGNKGVQTQCLYALGNMGAWKGETARFCKAVLKAVSRGHTLFAYKDATQIDPRIPFP